ncbi:MAG: squalene--hopene cyclase [Chloroflexi bacterium]|nr:squalene--hopene cyclase [Chloroflexota bacterium]
MKTQSVSSIIDPGRLAAVDEAIQRSQEYFLRTQHPDGYWWGELESNVTMAAEYLLLTHFLGVGEERRWRKVAGYLRRQQRADGTWAIYYGGPPDINATIESYFALKMAGVPADDPMMAEARRFVVSQGGVPRARIFTKVWLALFGQWDWRGVPVLPPEFMFLPSCSPLNIYEFASWARATVVPMLIILSERPVCPIPEHARIDELYPVPRSEVDYSLPRPQRSLSWRGLFYNLDGLLRRYESVAVSPLRKAAVRTAERWIVAHQEADGSWGGIQPPWVYSLIALKVLGYSLDHPVMKKGLEGFDGFAVEDDKTFNPQACLSPVWDTALAMIGLLDGGLRPDHPALVNAGRWLLREQILTGGDWQVKVKGVEPGGWAFEFENDLYPDTDDTAEVMIALQRTQVPDEKRKQRALARGLRWLLAMQSKNGGWGSFDKDNTQKLITSIPFCDFGEVIDYPTEDVTAHIVEMLGRLGYRADFPPLRRALAYLRREQEADGAWWGRWGVNYIYGTGAVLPALEAVGEDMSQPYVRAAVRWLLRRQNEDGGWGESCDSYADPALRGQGPSTASQTAWALLALLSAASPNGDGIMEAVTRGVAYLVERQEEDGQWEEPHFTATGFPRDFMIKYHLYRNYWPLMAVGRFRRLLEADSRGPSPAT